tara:strand:+ start:5721 stop:6260 length:540 start_codon:yes stop_codon:yes gene_type:complete
LKKYSKQNILSSISILGIARGLGVSVQEASSGNFTHKCSCPSPEHKNGSERTASLYIDSNKDNFFCFGCGASHNAIDFYMLCSGKTFSEAITDLSKYVDPDKVTSTSFKSVPSNFSVLVSISSSLRRLQRSHPEDIDWIEGFIRQVDRFLASIDRTDIRQAKKLLKKINVTINRRYSTK